MIIKFIIYGEPKGKVNMKPVFIKGHQSLVQPEHNTNYMSLVRDAWFKEAGDFRFEKKPLYLKIYATFKIPSATPKKHIANMILGNIRPTRKPDCDNISKVICDALNDVAFDDDSQICALSVQKYYGSSANVQVEIGYFGERRADQ